MTTITTAREINTLAKLSEDEFIALIEQAVRDENMELLDQLHDEDQRRLAAARRKAAATARKEARFNTLIEAGTDFETAYAEAYGTSVETQRRKNAIAHLRAQGYVGAGIDALIRAAHRDYAHRAWLAAENATNGYMLSAAGKAAGFDPRKLWSCNEMTAAAYASEELRAHWDLAGRKTAAEMKADLLSPATAISIRAGRIDFHK